MDEFESDRDPRRQQSIVILARSASSSESKVLMGTPEGKAMQFAARTTFMFSAINVVGKSQADESRIINLELTAHDNDPKVGRQIELTMQAFAEAGPAWCRYSADNAMNVIQTIDVLKAEMPPTDSRHKLNMATLLAGAYIALNGAVPTAEQSREYILEYLPAIERHALAHERNDAMECWNYLIAYQVRRTDTSYPLGHWLATALKQARKDDYGGNTISDAQKILIEHQMRIVLDGDNIGLLVANGAPPIDAIFESTKWRKGAWKRALGQIAGVFTPKNTVRIKGLPEPVRCIGIPFSLLPEPIDEPSNNKNI